ncbi:MAG: agmatine deiminase family protein [bacterium]|nr:agmatine deiminase family protein [bacterium]
MSSPPRAARALAAGVFAVACSAPNNDPAPPERTVAGTPPTLRVAAEWEPALGVLVRWPPYLPRDLFVELAHDSTLYVLVEDATVARAAEEQFDDWGIERGRVVFLEVPGSDDAGWTRDYGPHPVFDAEGGFALADARYDKTTPDSGLACDAPLLTPWNGGWGNRFKDYDIRHDDAAPPVIANALGVESKALPFVLTGGNFVSDGRGSALSTCILTNENRSNGLSDEQFFDLARDELGVERYSIVPNFEEKGIQHIDCLIKMLDGERLLVAQPPRDHALFARYERIADEHLATLRSSTGRPYQILRIATPRYTGEHLAAYTNSLILNQTVYVPLFGIPEDEAALRTWRAALPGHEVKGFHFVLDDEPALAPRALRMYRGIGWRSFDALHCRTRAVWDPQMLYIAIDPPDEQGVVAASIIAYSGEPLLADRLVLHWRHAGKRWQEQPLERGPDGRFRAKLTAPAADAAIEYYVVAADASGRMETEPRTAPRAVHRVDSSHGSWRPRTSAN